MDSEKWRVPSGELIAIPKSEHPYVCIESIKGDIVLCEECYKNGNLGEHDRNELAEIHYQFGLEYQDYGEHSKSVDALHQAIRLKQTADFFAALASSYGEIGDPTLEQEFYLQALRLDPNHFIANQNLKKLRLK